MLLGTPAPGYDAEEDYDDHNYYGDVELVATIKTFWLRLIQRKWKRIYKQRKHIIRERMRFGSLRQREMTGKWRIIPSHVF